MRTLETFEAIELTDCELITVKGGDGEGDGQGDTIIIPD